MPVGTRANPAPEPPEEPNPGVANAPHRRSLPADFRASAIGPLPQIPAFRRSEPPQQDQPLPQQNPPPPVDPATAAIQAMGQTFGDALVAALGQMRPSVPADPTKYPKAKDPGLFNGKKRRYLRTWIGENEICFRTAPNLYRTESAKVMFAGSFLEGDAKTWFTDYFKDPDHTPLFMEDWTLFTDELQRNFGVEDELGAAEADVHRLTMSEKDHATYFTARFRAIITNLQGAWSDRSLRNAYLQKLPPRLMSQFQTSGRRPPDDLEGLIKAVEEFDSAHWAGVDARQNLSAASADSGRDRKATPQPSAQGSAKAPKPASSSATTPKPATTLAKSSPLDNQLKDGKLTDAERKRRIETGSCLYCGEMGHVVRNCAKRAAARARAGAPQESTADSADAAPSKQTARATLTLDPEDSDTS
jgi:hypothetical protein